MIPTLISQIFWQALTTFTSYLQYFYTQYCLKGNSQNIYSMFHIQVRSLQV